MSGKTKIEWADRVWNPVVGCSVVSAGCTNCYAMRQAARWRNDPASVYRGLTRHRPGKGAAWTGDVRLAPEATLKAPLGWRQPARIFVNSMGDLFHESAPDAWIDQVFAVMALAPQHLFMILTKRPDRMWAYFAPFHRRRADGRGEAVQKLGYAGPLEALSWPLPNLWLGVSVEDQATADARIPLLLETPAAGRFVSAEPLLGPVDLTKFMWPVRAQWPAGFKSPQAAAAAGAAVTYHRQGLVTANRKFLDLVIAGGESGPASKRPKTGRTGARPMHPAWPRAIRDQCAAAGTPFNFKQWGEWGEAMLPPVRDAYFWPAETARGDMPVSYRVGKRAAGRTLDGRTHDAVAPLPGAAS